MKKTIALMLVVLLVLAVPSIAQAKTVYSNIIQLPKLEKAAPVEQPELKEAAVETEQTVQPEVTPDEQTELQPAENPAEGENAGEEAAGIALYAEPNGDSEILTLYGEDDEVEVLFGLLGWMKIRVNGFEGFVPAEIIKTEKQAEADEPIEANEEQTEVGDELEGEEEQTEVGEELEGEEEQTEVSPEVFEGTVIDGDEDGLPVYDAASSSSEILGYVGIGQPIDILEIGDEWVKIDNGEFVGYVYIGKVALVNSDAGKDSKIRSINIVNDLGDSTEIVSGTVVTFTAILAGFENDVYTVQWFEAVPGGEFVAMEGETRLSVSFPITEENFSNNWRVVVTLNNVE